MQLSQCQGATTAGVCDITRILKLLAAAGPLGPAFFIAYALLLKASACSKLPLYNFKHENALYEQCLTVASVCVFVCQLRVRFQLTLVIHLYVCNSFSTLSISMLSTSYCSLK